MKRHKLNTPLSIDSILRWLSSVVFARSQCETLPLRSHSGCDVSSTSQIPNTSLLSCLSPQLKSQTGVLRLVPCCDFSMHGAGGNLLLGFEFAKDGKSCARLSLIRINLPWEMLKRSIRGQYALNAMNYKVTVSAACKRNRAPPPLLLLFIDTHSESAILLQGWYKHVRINRKQRPTLREERFLHLCTIQTPEK